MKSAARIITFSKFDTSSAPLFAKLNWIPFKNRLKLNTVKYIFKMTKGMTSDYSKCFFKFITRINKRTNQDHLMLKLPAIKCNFLANSIFYMGAKVWNEFPLDIRSSNTLSNFLSNAKLHFK